MASLSAESMPSPPPLRHRALWGMGMFALFMGYCAGYSLVGEEVVSPLVSARWAIAATASWGGLLILLQANGRRLRALATGAWTGKLALLAGLTVANIVADQLSLRLSALIAGQPVAHELAARLYSFGPRALMLGAILFLALLLWERHTGSGRSKAGSAVLNEWLLFPECPMLRLRASDVSLIRSAGNYSELMTGGRGHLVRVTLAELAERLAALGFLRVHRQVIVNGRRIREVCRAPNGRVLVRMDDGETVAVGRRYVEELKDRLGPVCSEAVKPSHAASDMSTKREGREQRAA